MKAIIVERHDRGKQLMQQLDLDPREWRILTVGCALVGYRFERVVDLTAIRPMSESETRSWQEWFGRLTHHIERPVLSA